MASVAGVPEASGYVPAGWPPDLPPPGGAGFERAALGWLFDHTPPDYRSYEVLRRHPLLLARLAREHLTAAVEGCRAGYRTARADLRTAGVPPAAVDALLAVYEREGRRLVAAAAGTALLERALAGEAFTRPL